MASIINVDKVRATGSTTDGLVVDSSGRVTTPTQPSFEVTLTGSDIAVPEDTFTKVTFDTVIQNVGSCYDTSNGRFTAPVDGFYHFSASSLFTSGVSEDARLMAAYFLNGTRHRAVQIHMTSADQDASMPLTCNIKLSANDYVEYHVRNDEHDDDVFANPDWTWWTGFLIG